MLITRIRPGPHRSSAPVSRVLTIASRRDKYEPGSS
jgi:hypothetical protein